MSLKYSKLITGLFLCWLIAGMNIKVSGQQPVEPDNIRFGVISSQQGLSQSSVFCLAQDHKGFIWIGTRDGLNRYDGYNFITYKTDPKDTNSLSNNEITVIHPDRHGDIWVGTRGGGLNKYHNTFKPVHPVFIPYPGKYHQGYFSIARWHALDRIFRWPAER